MKQFTRLFTLAIMVVFAFSAMQAQNTVMTKAQALGLKSTGVITPAGDKALTGATRDVLLEEGFDTDWLPADWSVIDFHASENWSQSNVTDNNFDVIDPTSLFSAICGWIGEDQDEWLITPEIDAMGETPLNLTWYAGVSGPWLDPGATLRLLISTDDGATWDELWNAIGIIDPAAEWDWNMVVTNLDAYAGAPFKLAWNYVGNDGDVVGVDGVKLATGFDYIYFGNFDEFTVGDYLAETDDTGFWTTWTDSPGGPEDAFVSDEQSNTPMNSVEVEGTSTDLLFLFGDKTSGKYHIEIKYYVETGFGGYINIQHFEAPGIEWAHEVYFGAEPLSGLSNGFMYAGSPDSLYFQFPHDQWMQLQWMIDLDNDWAEFYLNDVMLAEWQFSLQAQGEAGTNQLGAFDIYAGAPTGDVVHYYFDDLGYAVLEEGSVSPIIDIDNSPMSVILEEGQMTTETFSMGNIGEDPLNYEIVVTYPESLKALDQTPTGVETTVPKNLNRMVVADPEPGVGQPAPSDREEVLQYDDGVYFSAIGNNTVDYEWRVAAKFPAEMLAPYVGMNLYKVAVYTNDPPLGTKIQVYGMGDFVTGQPGDMLAEQEFTANVQAWTEVTLDTPIYIDGQDLWVGYWVNGGMGTFVPGCDAGPADPNGDWIAFGPGFGHLADNPDLNYNWLIHAHLDGDPMTQWLSTDPTEGSLVQDAYQDVDVMIDATDLSSDVYTGKVVVRNNDPVNPEVKITVLVNVTVGVNENGEKEFVMIYPNPVNDVLNVGSNGDIQHIRVMNSVGQVVYDQEMNVAKAQVNTSNFQSGVYFVQIDTNNGSTTQKIVIE